MGNKREAFDFLVVGAFKDMTKKMRPIVLMGLVISSILLIVSG